MTTVKPAVKDSETFWVSECRVGIISAKMFSQDQSDLEFVNTSSLGK